MKGKALSLGERKIIINIFIYLLVVHGVPRDTENILVYTGKILPVTGLLKSAFTTSFSTS